MMQVIPKFKVQIVFVNSEKNVTFWIYDSHIGNVLRKVSEMQFTSDGLDQPLEIIIGPRND